MWENKKERRATGGRGKGVLRGVGALAQAPAARFHGPFSRWIAVGTCSELLEAHGGTVRVRSMRLHKGLKEAWFVAQIP